VRALLVPNIKGGRRRTGDPKNGSEDGDRGGHPVTKKRNRGKNLASGQKTNLPDPILQKKEREGRHLRRHAFAEKEISPDFHCEEGGAGKAPCRRMVSLVAS